MALKVKIIASSSSIPTAESRMGDASPQEALISGKSLQMSFTIIMNTKRLCPLNFFLKFWNFCRSWIVDANLSSPRLICERDPRIDEQNADLVTLEFLYFVNGTLALLSRMQVWLGDPKVAESFSGANVP